MKCLLLIILFVFLVAPAWGWEHKGRYDQQEEKKIDKYYYDSNSDYNWRYKYTRFKAPKHKEYHQSKKVNMRSNKRCWGTATFTYHHLLPVPQYCGKRKHKHEKDVFRHKEKTFRSRH